MKSASAAAALNKLRAGAIWPVAGGFGLGAAVGYVWQPAFLAWLQAPLHATLYYSGATVPSGFSLQICLWLGLLFALPALAYRLMLLMRPASSWRPAKVMLASAVLTTAGLLFAYYVSLPLALRFLRAIDVQHVHPLIAADSYVNFNLNFLAVFTASLQLPLLVFFADQLAPVALTDLRKWRQWVVIGAFAAALILPVAPDPVSQFMLALPVVVCYELSLWLVVWLHRRHDRQLRAHTPPAPSPQPQRLPMAIAVPHRPRVQRQGSMEAIRPKGPSVIDMRKH